MGLSRSRPRRHVLQLGALSLAAGLVIAGCGGDGGFAEDGGSDEGDAADSGEPAEEVTLTALVNVTDHLSQDWWEELFEPFTEANPHVTIEVLGPVQGGGVGGTLTELIAAGDVPDIVNNLRPDRENREVLLDIADQPWLGDVPLAAAYEIEGEQYMAHAGVQLQGVWFYNKDAFAEAGIDALPATIADLESVLDDLGDAGYVPIQTAGAFVTQQGFWGLGVPSVLGNDPGWYDHMREGTTTFSESYGEWVERWENWVEAGYMSDDAMGLTYDDATAAFFAGESAIYPMGSWLVGLEEDHDQDFEVGVMAPPVADLTDSQLLVGNAGMMWTITNTSEHADVATELLEWLTTDPDAIATQIARDGAFRDGIDVERSQLGQEVQDLLTRIGEENVVPSGDGYGDRWVPAGFGGEVNTELQSLWTGRNTDDILDTIDSWFEQNNN